MNALSSALLYHVLGLLHLLPSADAGLFQKWRRQRPTVADLSPPPPPPPPPISFASLLEHAQDAVAEMSYFSAAILFTCLCVAIVMVRTMRGKEKKIDAVDVVVVGCGLPKRGMGWYHLTQLLEMRRVRVIGVVEPFFLGDGCPNVPREFTTMVEDLRSRGIKCVGNVEELGTLSHRPTVCLIAGRTADNPRLFERCIDAGASTIYLEKPGAATVEELTRMKHLAASRYVKVYMGYNKNITPYVRRALDFSRSAPGSQLLFVHNNSYARSELGECFARNAEGMLRNMAIHELALLVSFFGATVDNLAALEIETDPAVSEKLTVPHVGPGGATENHTDFSRIGFRVKTAEGEMAGVRADRCGGNVSYAAVLDGETGKELRRFRFPEPDQAREFDTKCKADPEMMPYFHLQSEDYLELKARVVNSVLSRTEAQDVATIDVAIEALKLAKYATSKLMDKL
uniref:Gfo/Idh/MocA-like oxidoreductase N-terminal domain-containing protein n=1 Tax=Corethron hystrix TaxID=216773 RepID=A0A7S1BJM4_9STRA|mmetsp:Transcript_28809/g.65923  ORF Transcript_28809/g.65923 Transcript_28809/m.65923 type:complete len:457 (+) Transcript_28809:256-1626(+)